MVRARLGKVGYPAPHRPSASLDRITRSCQRKAGLDPVSPPKGSHHALQHHMCFHHVGEVLGSIPHKTQNYYKGEHENQIERQLVPLVSPQPVYEELLFAALSPLAPAGSGESFGAQTRCQRQGRAGIGKAF